MKTWFVAAIVFLALTLVSAVIYRIYLKKYNRYLNERIKNKQIKKITIVPDDVLTIVCLPLFLITCFLFLCYGFITNNYYYGHFGNVGKVNIEETSIETKNIYSEQGLNLDHNLVQNGKYVSWGSLSTVICLFISSEEELDFHHLMCKINSEESSLSIGEEAIVILYASDVEIYPRNFEKDGYRYQYHVEYTVNVKDFFRVAEIEEKEGWQSCEVELLELWYSPERNKNLIKKIDFKEIDRVLVKEKFNIVTDAFDSKMDIIFKINDDELYVIEVEKGYTFNELNLDSTLTTGLTFYDYIKLKGDLYLGTNNFDPYNNYKIICNNEICDEDTGLFYDVVIQYNEIVN